MRDQWRIDRKIARGGVGTVFAATDQNDRSAVAIKILNPEFTGDRDTQARFIQEGYAANQVDHPGVVRVLGSDVTAEGCPFLVMELLEGQLLEQRRRRMGGKLPLAEVYEIIDQLLDVLASAHEKGIVHRDVKPDNVFVTTEGRVKVLDFGFARMKSARRTEETATGTLLGTPGFMAPEQANGDRLKIDAQTDIWAVGATTFLLLTGEPVHDGENALAILVAAANVAPRSILTLEPGLSPDLAHVIDRALAFQRHERWPDARSMQSALRAWWQRQDEPLPSTKDPSRAAITRTQRLPPASIPLGTCGAPRDDDSSEDEGTLVMDSRPVLRVASPPPSSQPFSVRQPSSESRLPTDTPTPPPVKKTRALSPLVLFVLVATITMIVMLTSLLVILR